MNIKKLNLVNLRNFQDATIFLEKGFHTIIGSNNIGKSNILFAIRLVLDQNLNNAVRQLTKEDFNGLKDINENTFIKISIEFEGTELIELPNFPLIRTGEKTAEVAYFFAHKSKFYKNYSKEGLIFERDFTWKLYGGKNIDIIDLINMNTIPLSEIEGIDVNLITDFRDIFKHLSSKKNTLFRQYLQSRSTYENNKDELKTILSEASERLNQKEFIKEITNEIENKNKDITSNLFAENYSIDFDSINDTDLWDSINLYFKINGSKLSINKLGLGQKNILFLVLYILYLENNVKANPLNIVLIEEPEAHLHPHLQKVLFRKLKNMKKTQVIMTSHSPQIASDVEYKNMSVIYKKDDEVKSFTPFSEVILDTETERLLKRYFDVTRSELFFASKVVLVEGITEKFIIEAIFKYKYNFDLIENNISVIPIHGRHFHSFLPFFEDGNLEIDVMVVIDGDKQNVDDADFITPARRFQSATENRIMVFDSEKTLEIELFPDKNINKEYLKNIFKKLNHEQSYSNLMLSTDEWDNELMKRIKSTISKGRFAQQLSLEIDMNFYVPEYISKLFRHLRG